MNAASGAASSPFAFAPFASSADAVAGAAPNVKAGAAAEAAAAAGASPSPPAGASSPVPFAASPPAGVTSSRSVLLKSASPANSPPSSSPPLPLFDLPRFDPPAAAAAEGPPPPNANPPAASPGAANAGATTPTGLCAFAGVRGLGSAGKSVSSAGLNRVATSPTKRQSIALGLATDASTPTAPAAPYERPPTRAAGFETAHQPPRLALRWCDADACRRAARPSDPPGRRRTRPTRRGSAGGSGRTTARGLRGLWVATARLASPGTAAGSSTRRRARGGESPRARFSSRSSSLAISSSNVTWCRVAGDGPRPPPPPPAPPPPPPSRLRLVGRPCSLSMPAGGLPSPPVRAAGAGAVAGDGCASPSSSANLRRFSLSADAEGEGRASFVASAAVDARSASAASAANLVIALPLAPPPVAGALRAALTVRRSPTAAGPGRAGLLELSNTASRARFPSAFSGVNTSALATSATSSDSPAPAMSVQKRPMYRPAVCISSSIVAGTRARDH